MRPLDENARDGRSPNDRLPAEEVQIAGSRSQRNASVGKIETPGSWIRRKLDEAVVPIVVIATTFILTYCVGNALVREFERVSFRQNSMYQVAINALERAMDRSEAMYELSLRAQPRVSRALRNSATELVAQRVRDNLISLHYDLEMLELEFGSSEEFASLFGQIPITVEIVENIGELKAHVVKVRGCLSRWRDDCPTTLDAQKFKELAVEMQRFFYAGSEYYVNSATR